MKQENVPTNKINICEIFLNVVKSHLRRFTMRKVVLTLKEQEKYTTIKKLVETGRNKQGAVFKSGEGSRKISFILGGMFKTFWDISFFIINH